ncbi:MAG: hypothetical protein WBM14_11785 [Terracidiphilus sp.]
MKTIQALSFGFRDAENYRRRENKDLLNRFFVHTPSLDEILDAGRCFLVGEKGTGKTAYAVYLSNNNYHEVAASLKFIRETEYQKFLELKRTKSLVLTDYTNIWKVIICILLAESISEQEGSESFWSTFKKFACLKKAIDEYYLHAFSPEIISAMQLVEESSIAASILSKYAKLSGDEKETRSFSETRFQTNLLYIQRHLETALRSLKLKRHHLLFIDGIDIRPSAVPYEDYLECVKGLANAVWSLNNDFFANIKDSKGRIRVVLLIRPDIFDSLGLQNTNSKIKDNSVVLDWGTTYKEHRRSSLFCVSDKMLASQQEDQLPTGATWDHYFPFDASNIHEQMNVPTSFITVLRHSLYRPRDVLVILSILRENLVAEGRGSDLSFRNSDFENPTFTRKYSDYLLGEVKDHLSFYYRAQDYEILLKFFQFLNGHSRFTYDEFIDAYTAFDHFLKRGVTERPAFCESSDRLLQFLYELNVLSYIIDADGTPFFGYCFRERTPSNISPKVRTHVRYDIHYGLMKALDLGKHFRVAGPGVR